RPPAAALAPLSLHDALPIWQRIDHPQLQPVKQAAHLRQLAVDAHRLAAGTRDDLRFVAARSVRDAFFHEVEIVADAFRKPADHRSEEHTSELQSRENLVCRL